jgi:hypothetical protein
MAYTSDYGSQSFDLTPSLSFNQFDDSSIQYPVFQRAPLDLKQAGNLSLSKYVLYLMENRQEFLKWWLTVLPENGVTTYTLRLFLEP